MDASPFQVVIRSPILGFGQEAVYLDASPEVACCRAQRWCLGSSSGLPELCRLSSSKAEVATHSNPDRVASARLVRMRRRREYLIEVADSREPKLCAASRPRAEE